MTGALLHDRSGRCLCGAVGVQMRDLGADLHACHCDSCRRNNGAVSMTVMVPADALTVTGAEWVETYVSSEWASRSFCRRCGSSLWFRMNQPGSDYYLSAGLLDDLSDMRLAHEIYFDSKPDAWGFAGPTEKLTGAEVEALFADPASDPANPA